MSDFKWATVTAASPPMVVLDGTTVSVPAVVGAGVSLAVNQRVLVSWVPPSTVVFLPASVAAASSAPVGQNLYLQSTNGTVFKLSVSDVGSLKADPV